MKRRFTIVAIVLLAAISAGLFATAPAPANELAKLDTSLKLMPADAAFYSSMLRNREQIEAIAESKAWEKIVNLPVVQQGLMIYKLQASSPESVPGQIEKGLADPQMQDLLAMLGDMFSDDVFIYGGKDFVGSMQLLQEVVGAMRFGPIMLEASGQAAGIDDDEQVAKIMLGVLADNLDKLKTPEMIIGFKIEDTERAKRQLAKLELIAGFMMMQAPEMDGRFKRQTIDGYEYITISLDGKMVPWDEVPIEDLKKLEANEGDVEKLIARAKEMTIEIALGVRDDYLLLSVGPTNDHLKYLGKGKLLIDRDEFKPLAKFADKRLASVGYVSKDMMGTLTNSKKDIDDLLEVLDQLLPLANLPDDTAAKIKKDAKALAADLKTMIPEPGAVLAFSFLCDKGIESYTYSWAENLRLDGSKPLSLLDHLGGSPLGALVARGKNDPAQYDMLSKWAKVGYGYFQDMAVPQMPKREQEEFQQAMKIVEPLAARIDTANRDMLFPALADGQVALLIDGKLKSKQLQAEMPKMKKPMPMIEPAIVIGVSDAELLRKGVGEYVGAINDVIDAVKEIEDADIPEDFELPKPEAQSTDLGTIYSYPLPKEWGLDKKILPNVGLSEKVAVITISKAHTERLLKATPLKVGGLLGDSDRNLAAAGVCNWAAFVDAATPWVDYAVEEIMAEEAGTDDPDEIAAVSEQVHTVLDVLKVIRKVTSETYLEDDATVTHSLMEISDVE